MNLCLKKDSTCSIGYSRNAVVSISVGAAVGWAEMMYVWRETPTTPPPSLSLSLPLPNSISPRLQLSVCEDELQKPA